VPPDDANSWQFRGRCLMEALSVEERLNRLEKENKRLRLLALGVVLVFVYQLELERRATGEL
jgi:hypothetical protein